MKHLYCSPTWTKYIEPNVKLINFDTHSFWCYFYFCIKKRQNTVSLFYSVLLLSYYFPPSLAQSCLVVDCFLTEPTWFILYRERQNVVLRQLPTQKIIILSLIRFSLSIKTRDTNIENWGGKYGGELFLHKPSGSNWIQDCFLLICHSRLGPCNCLNWGSAQAFRRVCH